MNTQSIIENLLDMWLSEWQLAYLRDQWRAFTEDPYRFRNCVDMVKEDLAAQGRSL